MLAWPLSFTNGTPTAEAAIMWMIVSFGLFVDESGVKLDQLAGGS